MAAPEGLGDLEDHALFAGDAWVAAFARRRAEAPVAWQPLPGGGYWAVARHADVRRVLTEGETFLAGYGTALRSPWDRGFDPQRPSAGVPGYRAMNATDPPEHAERRALLGDALSPAAVDALAPGLQELAEERLAAIAAAGGGDLVADLAEPLVAYALGEALGLPAAHRPALAAAVRASTWAHDPVVAAGRRPAVAWREAEAGLGTAIQDVFAAVRGCPGLAAHIAGCPGGIAPRDAQYLLRLLALAGQETTVTAVAGALWLVLSTPDGLARLTAAPALVPQAQEEAFRWLSPIVAFARLAARDTAIAGVEIQAGQRVACFFPSANRDEAVFDEPDAFRLDRRPNPHLAFGAGDHACPGAGLARLQARVALEALLAAPGAWTAGTPTWWRGGTKRGLRIAPVTVA